MTLNLHNCAIVQYRKAEAEKLKSRHIIIILNIMEKKSLIKFENVEIELLTSESELSEVRGGGIGEAIMEILFGGGIEINLGCNTCN